MNKHKRAWILLTGIVLATMFLFFIIGEKDLNDQTMTGYLTVIKERDNGTIHNVYVSAKNSKEIVGKYTINEQTKLVNVNCDSIAHESFKVGQVVEMTNNGLVLTSIPFATTALKMVLKEENEAEAKATRKAIQQTYDLSEVAFSIEEVKQNQQTGQWKVVFNSLSGQDKEVIVSIDQ
ncbi:hypothetical protein [Aureibacillus halotolerans]|uniref:DUF3221 domain-containing protein n=1 Tax=Aureibacillus halotolerans TaxID=1508390 RepID=A0A4R6U7E7_9BACI|nr:hypothetical protein [Aureibacillus halotolerans]TDQ41602.1 hypothetical protein EV213_103181 [Aureibacillus halotolerans]